MEEALRGTWRFCIVRQGKLKRFVRFPFRCWLPGCLPAIEVFSWKLHPNSALGHVSVVFFYTNWAPPKMVYKTKIETKRSLAIKKTWLYEEMFFFSRHMKRLIFFVKVWTWWYQRSSQLIKVMDWTLDSTVILLTPAGKTPESARPCARTCIKHKADGKVPLWDRN